MRDFPFLQIVSLLTVEKAVAAKRGIARLTTTIRLIPVTQMPQVFIRCPLKEGHRLTFQGEFQASHRRTLNGECQASHRRPNTLEQDFFRALGGGLRGTYYRNRENPEFFDFRP